MVGAASCLGVLVLMNRNRVYELTPYLVVGAVMWTCVLKSGVHATLAGVLIAWTVPMKTKAGRKESTLAELERILHPWVYFLILPMFAFANAGVPINLSSLDALLSPVPLGVMLGLFFGKQLGVMLFTAIPVWLGWAALPQQSTWPQMYGLALLCGIGFTMSLFIGSLAFEHAGPGYLMSDRLGILAGSFLSAIAGALVLRFSKPIHAAQC
jgi:NhaA family Na+:H+ antiporter